MKLEADAKEFESEKETVLKEINSLMKKRGKGKPKNFESLVSKIDGGKNKAMIFYNLMMVSNGVVKLTQKFGDCGDGLSFPNIKLTSVA